MGIAPQTILNPKGYFHHHSGQLNSPETELNSHVVTETYPHKNELEEGGKSSPMEVSGIVILFTSNAKYKNIEKTAVFAVKKLSIETESRCWFKISLTEKSLMFFYFFWPSKVFSKYFLQRNNFE